jgi:hypothetical protein
MRLRDLPKRTFKNEVEIGYNKVESKKESSRCYLCHYQYEINDDLCVLCDECLLVRPVNECIKEVSSKSISSDGQGKHKKNTAREISWHLSWSFIYRSKSVCKMWGMRKSLSNRCNQINESY